ncbi:GntR family transcriptional regulator [Microvirga sp. TS319]|uniref:GntR family transcriptional regulator n=1 Tax=Microvirga sp. TS319 TaxID=3241165 RepID=UPI00351A66F0
MEYVRAGIAQGRFSPGQKLVEIDICTVLDLKRGPVREGLRMLAGQGVLDLIPNRGAWVRKLDRKDLADMVQTLASLNAGALFQALRKNESARLKAVLDPIVAEMRLAQAARSYPALMREIACYHRAVIALSGNRYLTYLLEALHVYHYHRSMALELTVENWPLYVGTYERAHEAVIRKDFATAATIFEEHAERLQAVLGQDTTPAIFR